MGELDYSFNLFYLIVNLDCVHNLQTSLWKTTASALSMSLLAVILTFAELILPKNKSTSCKMEWELHSNNNSNNDMIKAESPKFLPQCFKVRLISSE